MSAKIFQFMPRPKHNRAPVGFPRLVLHSTARPEDRVEDHADTSPCEYVGANPEEIRFDDG
jgi:hypothetical protein